MSSLSLKHIYKVYPGGVRAVNDFNLEIKDKSFVVLVGPSGCGKSTTLRMIAGLENITSGQLYIDDQCVNDVESKNRDVAMVFQSYALYPHMTVFQNMAFGLKLRHENSALVKEKVLQAAETLEIQDLLDRKPKELSGGQRQRVALGRAIVREPNVFLLDEPLSNLDAKLRVQTRTEITKLHEKLQTTFIYVTHDQTEAMTMGDVIVVMKDGFIQQADTPITLFEDPTNLFVATFLGSPQMNIIPSTLVEDKGIFNVQLANNKDNVIALRKETSKQLLSRSIPLDREYLFGIRPDHISLGEKGVPAVVEVIEQLGDETLLYVKIKDFEKSIAVKMPLTGLIKVGQKVNLVFDVKRVYIFDKESEYSLVGVPLRNLLPAKYENNSIKIGKENAIILSDEYSSHLLNSVKNDNIIMSVKPEDVSLDKKPNDVSMKVHVEFVEERTLYNAVFAHVEGIKELLVFRVDHDAKIKQGDEVEVYFPIEKMDLLDEKLSSLRSREIIYQNKAVANVFTKNEVTSITIEGGQILKYPNLNISDGKYNFVLDQEKIKINFPKKMAKSLDVDYVKKTKDQYLNFSCYDEEPSRGKNHVFGLIKGFPEYVTIVIPNNFSVYKMPKFTIDVPSDAFKLEPIAE